MAPRILKIACPYVKDFFRPSLEFSHLEHGAEKF